MSDEVSQFSGLSENFEISSVVFTYIKHCILLYDKDCLHIHASSEYLEVLGKLDNSKNTVQIRHY